METSPIDNVEDTTGNTQEPNPKPMEISPIDNVEDTTGNTPETVKDESQKRTSFTERLAMMVGMRSRDAAVEETKAEKSKYSEKYPRERQRPTKTRIRKNRDQRPTTGQQRTMEQLLLS